MLELSKAISKKLISPLFCITCRDIHQLKTEMTLEHETIKTGNVYRHPRRAGKQGTDEDDTHNVQS